MGVIVTGEWNEQVVKAMRLERWAEAAALCASGLKQHPGALELRYRLGLCQVQLGQPVAAGDNWQECAADGHLESHYQLGLLALRQRGLRPQSGERAIEHFETILREVAKGNEYEGLDRVYFALGGQYGEDPQRWSEALRAYRQGLALNPLSAVGHSNLGQLLLQDDQVLGALGEFKVAIQLAPSLSPAYVNLARLFLRHIKPAELEQEYRHIFEEFEDGAPQVIARLTLGMVELGKEQVYEGFYTKGHQIKNLMGIIGSRMRGLGRKVDGDLQVELNRLGGEHEALYDEWIGFLAAMKLEKIRPVVIEADRLVRRVAELVRSQTWKSKVQVRLQEGVPRVEADERMLREAIINLCLNALEILEEGAGGQVVIGVGYDEERAQVFIEVEDDGPGIDERHIELVFEPGFTTRERGNGYGLSIARRIAQAHHGALRVKSRQGHGTVFRLDLPIAFSAGEN